MAKCVVGIRFKTEEEIVALYKRLNPRISKEELDDFTEVEFEIEFIEKRKKYIFYPHLEEDYKLNNEINAIIFGVDIIDDNTNYTTLEEIIDVFKLMKKIGLNDAKLYAF
jgi:glutaredoxin 2